MRNSLLAMLIAFGVAMPAIAAEKPAFEHPQMQKDTGSDATTGATTGKMKADDATTGAATETKKAAPSETKGEHQPMQKDADKKGENK